MNLKKIVTWLVVAFVVFYVIQAPEASAQLVRNAGTALGDAASSSRGLRRLARLARRDERRASPARRPVTGAAPVPSRAGKDAAKYLLDDEEPVLTTRRHWAVLIEPTVKFLPVFVVGGWLFLLRSRQPGHHHRRARRPRSPRWATTACASPSGGCGTSSSPSAGCCSPPASSCAR